VNISIAGVGGGGAHVLGRLAPEGMLDGLPGLDFLIIDTDWAALRASRVTHRVELRGAPAGLGSGGQVSGLGSGGKTGWAERCAELCADEIRAALAGADLVLVVAGMGGGTGGGAGPVVARLARESGALALGIVTRPLLFERSRRAQVAEEGLSALTAEADSVVVVPGEGVLTLVGNKVSLLQIYSAIDETLCQGVRALVELSALPGFACLDFAAIRATFQGGGSGVLGIGAARGKGAAAIAARGALASPLLDAPVGLAQEVIFQVRGGPGLIVQDILDVREVMESALRADAGVVYNAMVDDHAPAESVTVVVFATGIAEDSANQ
jgi:cell division protein FtsZ